MCSQLRAEIERTALNSTHPQNLTIAIMAGGQSRRMGVDKLALVHNGEVLLDHTIQAAVVTGLPVLVVGRKPGQSIPAPGIDFIADLSPGSGPLGGVLTALTHVAPSPILALAADLPLVTTDAINWLATAWSGNPEIDGLVVQNGEQLEPLFAVYTSTTRIEITKRMNEGRRSLHGLIEARRFDTMTAPQWVADQLYNVNEPADWQRIAGGE